MFILRELSFFYIMYKLYVFLVMLLSGEVSVSISFLMLFKFCGRVFGNIHCVGAMGCYSNDVQLYNRCVHELLILARTWFAFGLPSKTGCETH
jgi:hypothetical protein